MSQRPCPPQKVPNPIGRAELESLRQKTVDLISSDPQKAAHILADWLGKATAKDLRTKKSA